MTLIRCKIWRCQTEWSTFFFAISTARLSLSVITFSTPLSFNFARWFTTADNSVFTFVSVFSRVLSCVLQLCSTARSLHSDPSLAGSLASSSRSAPAVPRQYSAPAGALGRLLQHLVVCCLVWSSLLRYQVCRKTCLLSCLSDASWRVIVWGVVRATHGLPAHGPQCTVGVLAGTHWGDGSSRVMSHQSANPLWLCRVSGHGRDCGRDRGRELSCGLVMWTSFIHALFKHTSSSYLQMSGCRAYENNFSKVKSVRVLVRLQSFSRSFLMSFFHRLGLISGFLASLSIVQFSAAD